MKQRAACPASSRLKTKFRALLLAFAALSASGWCGGPDGGALQRNQLMRQQQQDVLKLKMLQQQRAIQSAPGGDRERQDLERLQIKQQQRQQDLQYRQQVEPSFTPPDRESGVSSVVVERGPGKAREQGAAQLQRFDSELKQHTESLHKEKTRGEVTAPGAPATLQ